MAPRGLIGVLGTFGSAPFAGMAWMHCQYLVGLARLGYDVFYVESSSVWPYDADRSTFVDDPAFALAYIDRVLKGFGMGERWAYRPVYSDRVWRGPLAAKADDLLRSADAVLNIAGATAPEDLSVRPRLVYVGTDPVIQELRIAKGDGRLLERVAAHDIHFTYGENIGQPDCPVPPLPFTTYPMRQPTLIDLWEDPPAPRSVFSTVTNWEVKGYDVEYLGETYKWSKHHEYLKVLDLPSRAPGSTFELAMGMEGVSDQARTLLQSHGWQLTDAFTMSLDPWPYRDYIRKCGAELSVAKDMVVRLRSGWFSERSAAYLAAGRPVITQDTAFSKVLPTGEGLFAFSSLEDILAAVDSVNSDYQRHSQAAHEIAREYFDAAKVLRTMLDVVGI